MSRFQKTALAALLATILLIWVGAIVRATGSGLGCPDWPKCWGALVPPTTIEDVNWDELDMEKFQRKRPGVTREQLEAEFNPVHTWIEYVNRLTSMPVGLFTLATFVGSLWLAGRRPLVTVAAFVALALVGVNAWLGKNVVESGLKPGIITLHMALAILLLCVQVYIVFAGGERRPRITLPRRSAWGVGLVLFLAVAIEGVMGSQVREITDVLKKDHPDVPRSEWVWELEETAVYLFHRTFSWVILGLGMAFFWLSRGLAGGFGRGSRGLICGVVVAQMVLGVMMSHVSISPVVQVLHIGLSSVFVASAFWFLLAGKRVLVVSR